MSEISATESKPRTTLAMFLRNHPVIPLAVIFSLVGIVTSKVGQSAWIGLAILFAGLLVVVMIAVLTDANKRVERILTEELDQ